MIWRAPRTASTACSRGSAYSISSKRTSRGLAKTSNESATRSRCDALRPASRLSAGIVLGARRATRLRSPNTRLSSTTACSHSRRGRRGGGGAALRVLGGGSAVGGGGARRGGRRVTAVVGARQRDRRVREREELEVVVAVDVAVELAEHVVERERPVDGAQAEGGHAAQGDGGDDPERAEPHPRGAQLVAAVDGQLRAVG